MPLLSWNMKADYDIAIIGSGFSGSLLAMIARRLARSVILLERGKHPRFAIGESSTPIANLLLEELAGAYGLPRLLPLAKWGSWQDRYPRLTCGLKRGFTFYHHELQKEWSPRPDRANELLVAASPNDRIADTHWCRADVDAFFVKEAREMDVDYLDEAILHQADPCEGGLELSGQRSGTPIRIRAKMVFDASGPRGFLHHSLALQEHEVKHLPQTQTLYSHFGNVQRWDKLFPSPGVSPYPADDAAMHHVFEGGWIWVLRFGNGITSAGVAATRDLSDRLRLAEGAAGWDRLLQGLPSVREQFSGAQPVRAFSFVPKTAFRSATVAGNNWALLPSAAGFIDPLLSTGFPLTLLGISRLAKILETSWGKPHFSRELESYARQTASELDLVEQLVGALYRHLHDFELFTALTLLYFAAASFTETVRRLGHPERAGGLFLLGEHGPFAERCQGCLRMALGPLDARMKQNLLRAIDEAIEPIDIAGLANRKRRNHYPVLARDLIENRAKVGATVAQVDELLSRCGML